MPIEEKEEFVNPIDEDKIAENPHLLPYASNVGSAVIKPIDKGRVKGLALDAMYEQTNVQLNQLREQVETLVAQANHIHERVSISEKIYQAEIGFIPLIKRTYHLYMRKDESYVLSMIGPKEWGSKPPFEFKASVTMLSDHTWNIIEGNY